MKLGELSPMLDPRKPLRLVGVSRTGVTTVDRDLRRSRRSAMLLPAGHDLAAVDRTIRAMGQLTWLAGAPTQRLTQTVARLNSRPRLETLRNRAVAAVDYFTGASTGVLAALLVQEHEQLATQLRADVADRWPRLQEERLVAGASGMISSPLTAVLDEVRTVWEQLAWIDELEYAAASGNVLGLSAGAAQLLTRTSPVGAAKLAQEFGRRDQWGAGMAWLPHRELLVAWSATSDGLHLFRIDGPAIADWVHSLATDTPGRLGWRHSLVPKTATLADNSGWSAAATDLAAIKLRSAVSSPVEDQPTETGPRIAGVRVKAAPVRVAVRDAVPPTRFLISAPESRVGVPPVAMGSGLPIAPTAATPGRWRQAWSSQQSRWVRVWSDAAPIGAPSRRNGSDPVLVTVVA